MALQKISKNTTILFLLVLMSSLFCKKEPVTIKVGDTVYLSGDKVRLRSGPTTKSTAVREFRLGDEMKITEISADTDTIGGVTTHWYKIETRKKNSGWIFGKFISLENVDSVEKLQKKMKGIYYFCTSAEKTSCTHILEVNGNKYEQKLFDSNIGITDYYTGTVSYSSKHIRLSPKTRIARYAFYKNELPYEQQYDYNGYAYHSYSDDISNLSEFTDLGMPSPLELYMLSCNEQTVLTSYEKDTCETLNHSIYYK